MSSASTIQANLSLVLPEYDFEFTSTREECDESPPQNDDVPQTELVEESSANTLNEKMDSIDFEKTSKDTFLSAENESSPPGSRYMSKKIWTTKLILQYYNRNTNNYKCRGVNKISFNNNFTV